MQMPSFFVFFNYLHFLVCLKSSTALTSRNISWATSVILVHTLSNNFYLKGFSISSKTGPSITVEMANFFNLTTFFRTFQKFHSPNQIKYLSCATSVKLIHTLIDNFYLRGFSISIKTIIIIIFLYLQP
jgi:hypothetical protein